MSSFAARMYSSSPLAAHLSTVRVSSMPLCRSFHLVTGKRSIRSQNPSSIRRLGAGIGNAHRGASLSRNFHGAATASGASAAVRGEATGRVTRVVAASVRPALGSNGGRTLTTYSAALDQHSTTPTTNASTDQASNMSYPISYPSDKPVVRLERLESSESEPVIYVLRFLGAETPDNRLTVNFLESVMAALEHVEKAWDNQENQKTGAALITTGETGEKSKFYSNGLDFEAAIGTPGFFDKYLNRVYEKLLSFPIPTIASIGGHCFAAGFGLIMAQDYRVMNGRDDRFMMAMNEIDFGAQIPPGLYATLSSKLLPHVVMRKMVLEGHRFRAKEALQERMIDLIDEGGPQATLDASISLAKTVGKKAGADAYQSNKLVMHAPFIAVLRENNEDVCARL